MASSHDGTSPRTLLQGLVPLCVLTLNVPFKVIRSETNLNHFFQNFELKVSEFSGSDDYRGLTF